MVFEQTLVYVPVSKSMPRKGSECLIYVDFGEDVSGQAIFYGYYDGLKWIGAMPWERCSDGDADDCVLLEQINGKVIAWAAFPKVNTSPMSHG